MKTTFFTTLVEDSIARGEPRTMITPKDYSGMTIHEEELCCCDWRGSRFERTVFDRCDLRGCDFSQAHLTGVTMFRCSIYGCEFPKQVGAIRFIECSREPSGGATDKWGVIDLLRRGLDAVKVFGGFQTRKIVALTALVISVAIFVAIWKI